MTVDALDRIGLVAIGRNEGERLKLCLQSVAPLLPRVVYVDSGSTDGSVEAATAAGAEVVQLDPDQPFTAARARNAGFARLTALWPNLDYVMFIDGDCELAEGWLEKGAVSLDAQPGAAVVCGRLRERRPEASVFNLLCDIEWDAPVGETDACGGIALFRAGAFGEAKGFRDDLVGGEEPELCLRLRERGWRILRIDADMGSHDAAMQRFFQWWRRSARAGFAFAEVSDLHRDSPKRIWKAETRRALVWAAIAPAALVGAVLFHPAAFWLLALYPAQAVRMAMKERGRLGLRRAFVFGVFNTLGKFAEAQGALRYLAFRRRRPGAPADGLEAAQ